MFLFMYCVAEFSSEGKIRVKISWNKMNHFVNLHQESCDGSHIEITIFCPQV